MSEAHSDRKWSGHLGLYRARVDAKTDEFLGMSRRRQMRRGAACAGVAAASAALTVLVILLIYEQSLAASSNAVQRRFDKSRIRQSHAADATPPDHPTADKLHRRNFVVDQESFSKMPLLINALQENSFSEPSAEQYLTANSGSEETRGRSFGGWPRIRKTSPRPFIFEYRTPTPSPFKKAVQYSSRNWIDSYRNAQRLKNLEHVINYLQKTVHAKVADLVPSSSDRLVTFSGAYIHPPQDEFHQPTTSETSTLETSESKKVLSGQPFKSDLLFKYKPNHPGEINMLADGMLRFSPMPIPTSPESEKKSIIPLFRPIKYPPRDTCYGIKCPPHDLVSKHSATSASEFIQKDRDKSNTNHSNLLSLMMDIFPVLTKDKEPVPLRRKVTKLMSIPRPSFYPKLMSQVHYKKPEISLFSNRVRPPLTLPMNRFSSPPRLFGRKRNLQIMGQENTKNETDDPSTTVVHINPNNIIRYESNLVSSTPAATTISIPNKTLSSIAYFTTIPSRDYTSTNPTPVKQYEHLNINDDIIRLSAILEQARKAEEARVWAARPPEIVKFNPEDAKVPDAYQYSTEMRTFLETTTHPYSYVPTSISRSDRTPVTERRSIAIKLRNEYVSSTSSSPKHVSTQPPTTIQPPTTTQPPSTPQSSTAEVVVPQINGHYRSLNQNSKNINEWLSDEDESSSTPPAVTPPDVFRPSYVEINRNNTKSQSDQQFGLKIKKDTVLSPEIN